MNDIDMNVVKAESDDDILGALQGLKLMQAELRAGHGGSFTLAFLRAYYERLPEEVARRLTEIDLETVGRITEATGLGLSGEKLKGITDKIAGDDAFAQVIRAANVYRERLGYSPLGPDGWPEGDEGSE